MESLVCIDWLWCKYWGNELGLCNSLCSMLLWTYADCRFFTGINHVGCKIYWYTLLYGYWSHIARLWAIRQHVESDRLISLKNKRPFSVRTNLTNLIHGENFFENAQIHGKFTGGFILSYRLTLPADKSVKIACFTTRIFLQCSYIHVQYINY